LTPQFATGYNISLILQQSMVIGILAVAQSLIILTAGIDLSIGATCVLGTVVLAKVAGTDPVLAMAAALGVCLLIGAINGALVTVIKLPPFIVTLGMFTIVAAATQLYAGSQTYRVADGPLTFLGKGFDVAGFPLTLGLLALLVVYAVAWYVLNRTATGRHVYAVGGNPVSASLAGIKTSKTVFGIYLASGLIAAIAAWAALGRIPTADPNAFQTANLDTITAVVIGGTSLFGGRGSVLGTLVGALIVGVLRNGLTLVGIDNLYQNIATGVLVIAAVALDQLSRRRLQ
ncbi:ABC transporter permease, partial [Tsukamurella pulmonis]